MTLTHRLRAAFIAFTRGDAQVRYVVSTRAESEAQRRKREAVHAQLRREITERNLVAAVERVRG
jgi:hypothetical protein